MNASATSIASPPAASSEHYGALELVKWLAVVAMLVDHVDLILLDRSVPWMHEVGRFAMPAFATAFGLGIGRSRDPLRIAVRLVPWALAAQIGWFAATFVMADRGASLPALNVLGVFSIAALVVGCVKAREWLPLPIAVCAILLMAVAVADGSEGGASVFLVVFAAALIGSTGTTSLAGLFVLPLGFLAFGWVYLGRELGAAVGFAAAAWGWGRTAPVPRAPWALLAVYAGHLFALVGVRLAVGA